MERKASEHLELVFGLNLKDLKRDMYVMVNKLEVSSKERLSDDKIVSDRPADNYPGCGFHKEQLCQGRDNLENTKYYGNIYWEPALLLCE